MYETILVPVDGSPLAERAIPFAADLARRTGAYLHIVQVHMPEPAISPDGSAVPFGVWDYEVKQQEHAYLLELAERYAVAGVRTHVELLDGSVIDALKTYSVDLGIDLVVMTTHGRGGLSRAWMGSVADAFVRLVRMPVLLIRAIDGMQVQLQPIRRILVPLDGSALSERVLHAGIELGRLTGASFTLLRVFAPTYIADHLYAAIVAHGEAFGLDHQRNSAEVYLTGVADRMRAQGLTVDTVVVSHENAATAILEFARDDAPDMIAMATHGRSGIARLAIGSVADKVMRASTLPVLLYCPRVSEPQVQPGPVTPQPAA